MSRGGDHSLCRVVGLLAGFLLVSVGMIFISCDSDKVLAPDWSSEFQEVYKYTGYNDSGKLATEGWIAWNWTDPTHIVGDWQLSVPGDIERQHGSPPKMELTGELRAGQLHVDLTPGIVCVSYRLTVTSTGFLLVGNWFLNDNGGSDSGRFIAERRRPDHRFWR